MIDPRVCAALGLLLGVSIPGASVLAQEAGSGILDEAERLREEARSVDAHKRAPLTFGHADSLYAEAGALLEREPPQIEEASRLGTEAARGFEHSWRLAPLADSIHSREVSGEQILLRREGYLEELAGTLELSARPEDDIELAASQILESTAAGQAERHRLVRELGQRTSEVAGLESRLADLEAELAELRRREATASAELRAREEKERRLREVRAVFDPDEAEILATDDRVTIRLSGLSFASGSAELGPENDQLLTKLERVVREFPGSRITVEGHTDNVGNDAANQALSQRRAIAVRDYLLSNVAMSADRLTAVGYGKNRPIAPNDTAAGRASNRRIDVTIDASGS